LSQEEKENITQKKAIMVVDGAVEYLLVITKILEYRYTPVAARSGEEALRLLQHNPVDLVLLDIEIPGMSGLELLDTFKGHPVYATIPVVIVTSHTRSDLVTQAVESGAKGYIAKPFREQALLSRIAEVLKASPGKMVAVDLSRRLIRIENDLFKIQILWKAAGDVIVSYEKIQSVRQEILRAFNEIIQERDKYISPIDLYLNRIYSLIRNENEQALPMLTELISELGVRDLVLKDLVPGC
jgi:CheY-like chemotaxis protein